MSIFIPDADLVRRAGLVVGAYAASRAQIIADRPGNPLGAEVRRYGEAVALSIPGFGEHNFNRAYGFTDAEIGPAGEVADWYEEADVAGAFEIEPGLATAELTALLHARGFRHTWFHATFAGHAELPQQPSPGVEVRRVATDADLAAFGDVYHAGWGAKGRRVPMGPWLTAPGWSLFLGLCDGQPAGVAVLYMAGGLGYLADSAVDPAWRRRGVHRALLDRRCAEAAGAGARVIISGADYLSRSHRNMLRKGLGLLYTEAVWTRQSKAAG